MKTEKELPIADPPRVYTGMSRPFRLFLVLLSILWVLYILLAWFYAHPPKYKHGCDARIYFSSSRLFSLVPFPEQYPYPWLIESGSNEELKRAVCPLTDAKYRYVVLDGRDIECAFLMDAISHADGTRGVGYVLRKHGTHGEHDRLILKSDLLILLDEMIDSWRCGGSLVVDSLESNTY